MSREAWSAYRGPRELDYDYAHEMFDYIEGELYWRERHVSHFRNYQAWRHWRRRFAGTQAGTFPSEARPKKHRRVTIDGRGYYLSRVIWLYHHGDWPDYCWHLDGNRQNCAIENLEALSREQHLRRLQETSTYLAIRRGLM